LRLGVVARMVAVPHRHGRTNFHVHVTGNEDLLRCLDLVGPVGAYKTASSAEIRADLKGRTGANTNRDVIPRAVWRTEVIPAMQALSMTHRDLASSMGVVYNGHTR